MLTRKLRLGGGLVVQDPENDYRIIGAIGVSGGSIEEDTECCEAGLKEAGFPTEFKGDASMPVKST